MPNSRAHPLRRPLVATLVAPAANAVATGVAVVSVGRLLRVPSRGSIFRLGPVMCSYEFDNLRPYLLSDSVLGLSHPCCIRLAITLRLEGTPRLGSLSR
jgi:hypothetical protein